MTIKGPKYDSPADMHMPPDGNTTTDSTGAPWSNCSTEDWVRRSHILTVWS